MLYLCQIYDRETNVILICSEGKGQFGVALGVSIDHGVMVWGKHTSNIRTNCNKGKKWRGNMMLHVFYRRLLQVPTMDTGRPVMLQEGF